MSTLSFPDALTTVLTHATTLRANTTETLPLEQTLNRTLAEPHHADRDQPPFDRSTRDGYAVRAADLTHPLTLIGSIRAGELWTGKPLGPHEAIEIMTGAPVPHGADAVLMLEHATLAGATLTAHPPHALQPGNNIVARAAEARTGAQLLPAGTFITAAAIAQAASCGATHLNVFARPTVAIIATGDELVDLNATPEPHQVRDSNSHALAALIQSEGGSAKRLQIAHDTLDDLRARLAEASTADLIVFSGGVSAGKFDLVEQLLTEAHAEFFFTGALIQPGRPIVFGRIPRGDSYTYFFGLPGNPISTQVCFHLFVAPLLRALCGRTDITPRFVEARLTHDHPSNPNLTRFLPAELISTWNSVTVTILPWQGSGDITTNARANCYAVLSPRTESFTAGETLRVLLR